MSESVWVVLDKLVNGRGTGYVEKPLLGTIARTRADTKDRYTNAIPHDWVRSGGGYEADHANGFVRIVRATLTLEQPKSKRSKP